MSDEKIEVEAERNGAKGVVLTLVNVPARRALMRKYGVHNAYVRDLKALGTFPPQLITDFYKGFPVRFRMNMRGFERLLESPRAEALGEATGKLAGLEAAQNKEGLTWEEWVRAAGGKPDKLDVDTLEMCTAAWRRGDDPTEYKGSLRNKK